MSSTSTNSWPPMNNNVIDGDYNNNHSARYSTDGNFFLAAVLSLAFVIALVFVLHLCIRRILRRSRHPPHHHMSTSHHTFVVTSQTQARSSGLAPSALAAIPTFEYRKNAAAESSTECAVCLSAVEEGEQVRLLPKCKHVFHVGCIDMWLQSHCTCPVCRAGVEPPSKVEEVVQLPTAGAWPGAKEGSSSSSSSRIGASLRRMLSAKEWSGRRPAHGDGVIEDVERQ